MVAGVCTPHAGSVIRYIACERPALGGCGADGVDACVGAAPEQLMQLCYKAHHRTRRLGQRPPDGLDSQAPVYQLVHQLAEAFSCLISCFQQSHRLHSLGPPLAKDARHAHQW